MALVMKKKIVERESIDQSALMAWARGSSNKWPELKLLYAIPNGRGTHIVTRLKMIREGILSGIPDLCLPVARGGIHALYIEMKSKGQKANPRQVEVHGLLESEGNVVFVCDSPERAKGVLVNYLRLKK